MFFYNQEGIIKDMSNSSVDNIREFINEMENGNNTSERLMLDTKTGKLILKPVDDTVGSHVIELSPDEANMFAVNSIFVITKEEIHSLVIKCNTVKKKCTSLKLQSIDDTDVLRIDAHGEIDAMFYLNLDNTDIEKQVLDSKKSNEKIQIFFNEKEHSIKSYWKTKDDFEMLKIIIPPVKNGIFSRIKGIFETSVLSDKKVGIIGVGSGGSPIALELAKQGVQHFLLVDPDRLETGNISRHICGLSDLGRFKTKAVSGMIKNKNPYAEVITLEKDITKMSEEEKEYFFGDVNLILCCTDSRESKLIVNRFCIEHNLVCLYGGAFRRAYGGQVLRVIPHKTLCYQCYISSMPGISNDNEISNQRQAGRIAYSDREDVPIEPGLSIDIAPISTFLVKLAILELLKDCEHTMQNLYEDLEASLYFWFNRREPGTQWEKVLNPLEYTTDKMSIMRWYGVDAKKNKSCPVCGKYCNNPQDIDIELFQSQ